MSLPKSATSMGIQLIASGSGQKRANLIFIHGFDEDTASAWSFSESGASWPLWLSKHHCPRAQLWSYNYQASLATPEGASSFRTHAERLADAIAEIVSDDKSGVSVILIARGLGGLLAQYACILADTREELRDIQWNLLAFDSSTWEIPSLRIESDQTEAADTQVATRETRRQIDAQFKVLLEKPYSQRRVFYIALDSASNAGEPDRQDPTDRGDVGGTQSQMPMEVLKRGTQLKNEDDPALNEFLQVLSSCLKTASVMENIMMEKRSGLDWFG